MNWHDWVERMGVPLPQSPDVESLIVAIVLIAGSLAIGWFFGNRMGSLLTRRIIALGGNTAAITEKLVTALTQYAVIALLLLIVGNSVALSPLALMVLAFALGVALGLLVHRVVKACGLGTPTALVLGAVALVVTTAATLVD